MALIFAGSSCKLWGGSCHDLSSLLQACYRNPPQRNHRPLYSTSTCASIPLITVSYAFFVGRQRLGTQIGCVEDFGAEQHVLTAVRAKRGVEGSYIGRLLVQWHARIRFWHIALLFLMTKAWWSCFAIWPGSGSTFKHFSVALLYEIYVSVEFDLYLMSDFICKHLG